MTMTKSTALIFVISFCFMAPLAQTPSWTNVYTAGSADAQGQFMGGNEIIHLLSHKGKLFAGNSYWMESNPAITKSCEVLVLDSPTGHWRVDKDFTAANLRMNAMKSVVFTTDSAGHAITPDTILLAVPTNNLGQLKIYTRDDGANTWTEVMLQQLTVEVNCRAIGNYKDPVTSIHRVFIGLKGVGIISGSYSPMRPGKIKWETTPEFADTAVGRFMGFTVCNGKLYCAADRDTTGGYNVGNVYERINGANPSWRSVFTSAPAGSAENTRGLSTVPSPDGTGEELIFSRQSVVRRLQPWNNFAQVLEASLTDTLQARTGYKFGYVLAAYNEFTPYVLPATGEHVLLIGLETSYAAAQNPKPSNYGGAWSTDGKYFIRRQNGNAITYELQYVVNNAATVSDTLLAVRDLCVSPFASDGRRVVYAGGFDCNSIASTNQAWIYRGDFGTTSTIKTSLESAITSHLHFDVNYRAGTITYSVPTPQSVKVRVFRSNGELVFSTSGNLQRAGMHSINIEPSLMSRGFYIVSLVTNAVSLCRRFAVVE